MSEIQVMADRAVLDAGGIAGALTVPDRAGIDTVTARRYAHPGLDDDRVVVRLVQSGLGAAEDLAMEFLGFAATAEPRPVGSGARRALGFPAWAVIHDPANGHHALAMVKEMERLARLAQSKPGAAKEGYDQLAVTLDRAAPHFLPTFWEQAGRAFIAAENAKTAGVCFGKAREAERVHALAIDEARLGEVHLEFALAGALPAKALTQYARDLAGRLPAAEAYQQLRIVALHRVAGGLAPHTGMAEDLARLAKAAGHQPDAEAEGVVAELLALPAVAKAPLGFWKSYRRPLIAVAKRDPGVRGRLLAILPDPPGYRTDATSEWVGLLEATGATAGLTGPVEPAAAPPDGPGAWLERIALNRSRQYQRIRCPELIALAGRMVPALLAEGRVLRPFGPEPWRADLDVLDVLIAGGVAVEPCQINAFPVPLWLQDTTPGQRDLVALAGFAGYAGPWRRGVRGTLTHQRGDGPASPEHIARIAAVPGLRMALDAWLTEAGAHSAELPLAALGDLVDEFNPLHSPAGAALAPQAALGFAGADVAQALARSLRNGLPTELGWPAYDAALASFATAANLAYDPAWPHLIVHDGTRAVVVGPDRIELEHTMRLPAGVLRNWWSRPRCAYVDGQLLVTWLDNAGSHGYWSDRPDDVFTPPRPDDHLPSQSPRPLPIPLAGGGQTTGSGTWHAGDPTVPARYRVASDGVHHWRLEYDPQPHRRFRWREYDPVSGAPGRFSAPRFFEEAGADLVEPDSVLLPAAGLAGSPLGQAGDLVGWRVVAGPDGTWTGEGVDGRRVVLPAMPGETLVGAVTLPGSPEVRAVTAQYGSFGWPRISLYEPGSGRPTVRRDTGTALPPPLWWHHLRPRDEAGSLALRAMTVEAASTMLKIYLATPTDAGAASAVRTVLPGIADDRLRNSLISEVVSAGRRAQWLATFGEYAIAAPAAQPQPAGTDDGLLSLGVNGLAQLRRSYGTGATGTNHVIPYMVAVADLLHGRSTAGLPTGVLPTDNLDWAALLGAGGAVGLRAVSPAHPADVRAALLVMLNTWREHGLVDQPGRLRVLRLAAPREHAVAPGAVRRAGPRTLVVTRIVPHQYPPKPTKDVYAVEHSPDGVFGPVDGMAIEEERRVAGWADPVRIGALVELATAHGPMPWRAELPDRLVELTGISRAEAVLLLAGLPGQGSWEANFLPTETRALLGLSMAEARAGRDALHQLTVEQRLALLDAAMPADPAQLWASGPDVDRLAAAWTAQFGQRQAIPDELLVEANRLLYARDGLETIRGLARPDQCEWLRPGGLQAGRFRALAVALPWLAYRLPTGDPLRAALPEAYDRMLVALKDPSVVLGVHYQRLNLPELPGLTIGKQHGEYSTYLLTPANLSGPDDPALKLFTGHPSVAELVVLMSVELGRLMDAIRAETGPAGRYPHDARWSAPELVAEVAQRYGIGADAAAYYLQLLALPDPVDRNVNRWTGWTAGAVKKLRAELVTAGLVVEAKRDRAGRSAFLPGGWLPLKAPNLPIESWKASLYGLASEDTSRLPVIMVRRPLPELFRASWERVTAGDEPKLRALG